MARSFFIEDDEVIPAICYCELQPVGFLPITDAAILSEQYKKLYAQREIDGKDYYDNFRVMLIMSIGAGTYQPAEVFALEDHIAHLQDLFISGNWWTAQSANAALALSGIYNQSMKDQLQVDIDSYIADNY